MQYISNLETFKDKKVTLQGWVRNKRSGKGLFFIEMRDGSGFCQVVVSEETVDNNSFNNADKLTIESSFIVTGTVVQDEKQLGGYEIQAESIEAVHIAEEYPLGKKDHGVEFLANNRHLWLRSRRQWAIMRVRNRIIFSIHEFFQGKGFMQMDPPIFTAAACEGTTTLFETDFYGQPAYLSQSGQLYGEAMAMAQGLIYTFGPTFRAEKSKTRRHLSEFWMMEPEMAFYDNEMNMELIEEMLKFIVNTVLRDCATELEALDRDIEKLKSVNEPFPKMSYDDAVAIIRGEKEVAGQNAIAVQEADLEGFRKQKEEILKDIEARQLIVDDNNQKKGIRNFNRAKVDGLKNELQEVEEQLRNIPQWIESAKNFTHGDDFGGSDETVLTRLFAAPVMVYNWPTPIKAFYMKELPDSDGKYVKGVDVLAPDGYGEIIGGAERETDVDILIQKIKEHDLPMEDFEWYLDLRRFGSVKHAGFGLGIERTVAWLCGIKHVRESIPFPRMYGRINP